jgi:hypothetical protein
MSDNSSNSPNLKLVMLFNARNQTYCVYSHNLTADETSQELDRLRRERLPAFTVEQRSHHIAKDADECWECRADISHAIDSIRCSSDPKLRSAERQF